MFASVADNFKRKKPLDVAEAADLKKWRESEACARDATNPMYCTSCQRMHYSSVATVEIYRLLLGAFFYCRSLVFTVLLACVLCVVCACLCVRVCSVVVLLSLPCKPMARQHS